MHLTKLEQIVGPIKRGQLAEGFISDARLSQEKDDRYLSEDARKVKPPPLTEDFSHLNLKHTKLFQRIAKEGWSKASKIGRKKRVKNLSLAGKIGGKVDKKMIVRN